VAQSGYTNAYYMTDALFGTTNGTGAGTPITPNGTVHTSQPNAYKVTNSGNTVAHVYSIYDRNPQLTLSFDAQGGSVNTASVEFFWEELTYSIEEMPVPTHATDTNGDTYAFAGWYFDTAFAEEYRQIEMPAHNLTVYAKWLKDPKLVDFYATSDATTPVNTTPIAVAKGGLIPSEMIPSDATMQAYAVENALGDFSGWVLSDGLTPFNPAVVPITADLNLYGKYKTTGLKVKYNPGDAAWKDGGQYDKPAEGSYALGTGLRVWTGEDIVAPDGYAFIGWVPDGGVTLIYPGELFTVPASVTLTAYCLPIGSAAPLVYDANYPEGTNATRTYYVLEGATVTVKTLEGAGFTSPTGYMFLGWSETKSEVVAADATYSGTLVGDEISVGSGKTVYGVWKSNAYTVAVAVTAASDSKVYDGTPLTNSNYTVTGLPSGYTVSATVVGSQTEVGSSDNEVTAYTITRDSDSQNVTSYFESVTLVDGTLTVTADTTTAITITAASDTKVYDGTPLTNSNFTVTGLPEGYTLAATVAGSQTNVGSGANSVASYTITRESDGADVTAYYAGVTTADGALSIMPRAVTIIVDNKTKVQGGVDPAWTWSSDLPAGLAAIEGVSLSRAAGEEPGTYAISGTTGGNPNYSITIVPGVLTITAVIPPVEPPKDDDEDEDEDEDEDDGDGNVDAFIDDFPTPTTPGGTDGGTTTTTTGTGTGPALYAPTPVAEAAEAPAVIEAEPTPLAAPEAQEEFIPQVISDIEPPLSPPDENKWALLNLILTIFGGALAIFLFVKSAMRRREDEEEAGVERSDEEEETSRRPLVMRLLVVVAFAVALVLFLLTEDMRNPMVLTDIWTIWHVIIAIVATVLAFLSRRPEEQDDEAPVILD
jgi:uncharacterized repeat protein (TIGR02543 family)